MVTRLEAEISTPAYYCVTRLTTAAAQIVATEDFDGDGVGDDDDVDDDNDGITDKEEVLIPILTVMGYQIG